jgi:hypothetical protein
LAIAQTFRPRVCPTLHSRYLNSSEFEEANVHVLQNLKKQAHIIFMCFVQVGILFFPAFSNTVTYVLTAIVLLAQCVNFEAEYICWLFGC